MGDSLLFRLKEELRRKAAGKSAFFGGDLPFQIPDSSVVEQASSDRTAAFTASLITKGGIVADFTAGLGVNTLAFAQRASRVIAIENNESRAECLRQNLQLAGIENVEVVSADCADWLASSSCHLDTVYADPSRREKMSRRVVGLEDYTPSLPEIYPRIRTRANLLIAKLSPLIELKSVISLIPGITDFYILEHHREVKEILLKAPLDVNAGDSQSPLLHCVFLDNKPEPVTLTFPFSDKPSAPPGVEDTPAEGYILDPAPSLRKIASYVSFHSEFPQLRKLDTNTSLYYASQKPENFPGRIFRILKTLSSSVLKSLAGTELNVISRNYPATAEEITKRYRLIPSGSLYIIACRVNGRKTLFLASL